VKRKRRRAAFPPGRRRRAVAQENLDRHRPAAPRRHPRRDDRFLRPVRQSQRGLLRRLRRWSGRAADNLDRRGNRPGDLL